MTLSRRRRSGKPSKPLQTVANYRGTAPGNPVQTQYIGGDEFVWASGDMSGVAGLVTYGDLLSGRRSR
jgi:hypothetical protein